MKWEWSLTTGDTSSSTTSPRRLARYSRRVWRGYWQVFGLAGMAIRKNGISTNPSSRFLENQWFLGIRSCLPLRGSSGLSPDSL
jgi:hypothetical protein